MPAAPTKEQLKQHVLAEIDRQAAEIKSIGREIWNNPELGYKEKKTGILMAEVLRGLGAQCRTGVGLTGVKGSLSGRGAGGVVAVAGDMDSVICPEHPNADIETGGAHSCGHHGQVAAVLGTAIGLAGAGAMQWLDGEVQFLGMPAEEYVELDFRRRLVDKGIVPFVGGKATWIALGELDGIDLYLASHSGQMGGEYLVSAQRGGTNGFIGKMIRFRGREAHAGGAPHVGINALNAAVVALVALNAQRDTFLESEAIRIHPIITKGGDLVNVVPADVRLETYVRGRTLEGIFDADAKLERAMRGGAMALGAEVDMTTLPGYLPQRPELAIPAVCDLLDANGALAMGPERVKRGTAEFSTASSDFGDVSHIMPAARITTGGVDGPGHSKDFRVTDEYAAYVVPAKVFALTIIDLLWDGAAALRAAKAAYTPVFTPDGYVRMWREKVAAGGKGG
ncbi:MAG: amidohydrolase [Bacillota bacterium]|nr:amidohydrolase [Bacillota bacterium]